MNITVRIQRFNPQLDKEPYTQDYQVDLDPEQRVLDALIEIKRNLDGTLAFRRSCAHGVCGSDAMIINGKNCLACKTLLKQVVEKEGDLVEIKPLSHLRVERDLMVDQSTFFSKYRSVQPFLLSKDNLETSPGPSLLTGGFTPSASTSSSAAQVDLSSRGEFIQSPEDRSLFDEATKCILCAACYSACPILDKNPDFIGPAAIVQAARFINDSRDMGLEPRLKVLDSPDGVWPCENHFECTKACPREIKITKLINQTKRQIKKYREERGQTVNDGGLAKK
jgi:succinate dehydrogenase / fumarate reductase iron-sulfur subunit